MAKTKLSEKQPLVQDKETTKPNGLAQQYGGVHPEGWVDLLPESWVPYIQLSRLSPPAGFFLIYFPHTFGALHAASVHDLPYQQLLRVSLILLGGSFFCNNASHAWNDLVDAPVDAQIERTRTRPIPRGAITYRAAFLFACTQAMAAAAFLLFLPRDASLAAVPTIIGTVYYPWAKRHTNLPQFVLGFCLTWGIMVGSSGMGVSKPWMDASTVSLLLASILWVVVFDTIYAHQDIVDDLRVGVKSTAILIQGFAKPALWSMFLSMIGCLIASGYYGGMGLPYYGLVVGGCVVSVGSMIARVDLADPASCWRWFSQGFWLTGAAIASGLLAEYLLL